MVAVGCLGGTPPATGPTPGAAAPESGSGRVAPASTASPVAPVQPTDRGPAPGAPSPAPGVVRPLAGTPIPARPTPAASVTPLPPADRGTALRAIQDRGRLIAGVPHDVPGYGLLNPTMGQPEGFDVEIARRLAIRIFGDPAKVELRPTPRSDAFAALEQGTVDLVVAGLAIDQERFQLVDFSYPYLFGGQGLLVPAASPTQNADDLADKPVATLGGAAAAKALTDRAPEVRVVSFDTLADALAALDSGDAVAITADQVVLTGVVKQSPERYRLAGGPFSLYAYGIALPRQRPELLEAVNAEVLRLYQTGEWATLYEQHIPPRARADLVGKPGQEGEGQTG